MKVLILDWLIPIRGGFEVRGVRIDRSVPTITFVNRLERLRGFTFSFIAFDSKAALNRPCVDRGSNEVGYGGSQGDTSAYENSSRVGRPT